MGIQQNGWSSLGDASRPISKIPQKGTQVLILKGLLDGYVQPSRAHQRPRRDAADGYPHPPVGLLGIGV